MKENVKILATVLVLAMLATCTGLLIDLSFSRLSTIAYRPATNTKAGESQYDAGGTIPTVEEFSRWDLNKRAQYCTQTMPEKTSAQWTQSYLCGAKRTDDQALNSSNQIVGLTWALVGVACVQAFIYWLQNRKMSGQLDATTKANGLTRDIFIASHRPIIVARGLFMYAQTKGKPVRFRFSIHNKGDTDAKLVDFVFYIAFNTPGHGQTPVVMTERPPCFTVVEVGRSEVWTGTAVVDLTGFRYEGVKGHLTFRGQIGYEDLSRRRRVTSFLYEWHQDEAHFRRVPNSEFNYED